MWPTLNDWGGTPHLLEVSIYVNYLEISYLGDSSLHGLLESVILCIDSYIWVIIQFHFVSLLTLVHLDIGSSSVGLCVLWM